MSWMVLVVVFRLLVCLSIGPAHSTDAADGRNALRATDRADHIVALRLLDGHLRQIGAPASVEGVRDALFAVWRARLSDSEDAMISMLLEHPLADTIARIAAECVKMPRAFNARRIEFLEHLLDIK